MNKDIGWAIAQIRKGESVARFAWLTTRRSAYIRLQVPDENSKMNQPYIYTGSHKGALVPWVPDHADILAYDWGLYNLKEREARGVAGEIPANAP